MTQVLPGAPSGLLFLSPLLFSSTGKRISASLSVSWEKAPSQLFMAPFSRDGRGLVTWDQAGGI